jgi:8-oxo-dGTP pyrophosphatase MutT (NUDIX family)
MAGDDPGREAFGVRARGAGVVELVDVLDDEGRVVGTVTRAEMRAGRLRHRSVGIAVRRPGDRAVLVHQRAGWKDVWPSYWDLAFGGVCTAGESFETTAVRELAEEAGITVTVDQLQHLGDGAFVDDTVDLVARVYEVEHAGPFTFADGEVERIEWVPFADLEAWVAAHEVVPDTVAIGLPLLRPYSARP